MSLKDISYLELWQPLWLVDWAICAILKEGIMRNKSVNNYEIILNLDQWFKRRSLLKIFLIWSSGGPFVQWI